MFFEFCFSLDGWRILCYSPKVVNVDVKILVNILYMEPTCAMVL